MSYVIAELKETERDGFAPRGGGAALWRCKDPEVMLSGPAETGKTYSCLQKLDALMWKYAGAQSAIVRKTYASMTGSVLQTYEKKVLGEGSPVTPYGGEKPQWYDYPNGSRVWVGGMDNPTKVLSSERDIIYVNQAEELTLDDWETLTTRATGRAGNIPYAQVFGDCNPWTPQHWIRQRSDLTFLESRHEDNPTLFDENGALTEQGRRSLAVLDKLSGPRKQRLRYGKWVAAEGVVYEDFDRVVHLRERFAVPDAWRKIRTIDFGYTNPFVCQWWAVDGDGRMYLYRELYMSGRTVKVHAKQINELSAGERYEATIADHDAEDRATLEENGIKTIAAHKAISPGIQATQERLKVAGDGRPRLYVFADALIEADQALVEKRQPYTTEHEFDSYVWPQGQDGKPQKKEVPVDAYNHGMDAMRYAVAYVDKLTNEPSRKLVSHTGGFRR
jgi:PBSX family phage terminase large subunit